MRAPYHLVVAGTGRHGVTLLAHQVAAQVGATTVTSVDDVPAGAPVHVHVTDRLFGATPEDAAARLRDVLVRHPTTVTLHDVPQPSDGTWFERRRDCYAEVVRGARGWVTSSATERTTLERHCAPPTPGGVVPLPLVGPPTPAAPGPAVREHSIGVFGWIYPGKGHDEALDAAARLGHSPDERPAVAALGATSTGHEDLVAGLHERAGLLGVRLEVTGWLEDDEAAARLRSVGVGLVAHANLSASGSLNSWLAAGRRPLVRAGDYTREMADLRPGTVDLYPGDAGPTVLAAYVADRLAAAPGPELTGPAPGPDLAAVGRAYLAWWAGPSGAVR